MKKEIESTQDYLSKAINLKKEEMIQLGMIYGLRDERTLKCSQELDVLLNEYTNVNQLCYI